MHAERVLFLWGEPPHMDVVQWELWCASRLINILPVCWAFILSADVLITSPDLWCTGFLMVFRDDSIKKEKAFLVTTLHEIDPCCLAWHIFIYLMQLSHNIIMQTVIYCSKWRWGHTEHICSCQIFVVQYVIIMQKKKSKLFYFISQDKKQRTGFLKKKKSIYLLM